MDRPGLEPGKSSAYEAAALTNCANDPYITAGRYPPAATHIN